MRLLSTLAFATVAALAAFPPGGQAATPVPAAASGKAAFDPGSVPVTTKPLPAFPYLDWPEGLKPAERKGKSADFDQAWFIAGAARHAAEGRVHRRHFYFARAGMSRLEAVRNYENALKALGAVRIDTIHPLAKDFPAENAAERTQFVRSQYGVYGKDTDYATYLIRTPDTRVWIGLTITGNQVRITTLEEKAMVQSVALTSADEMKASLDKQGFVALYINFDTDKALLRDDGKPTVDEIARLLKAHPGLMLSIEGHTDNSGDARRNKALSQERAATIVTALKGAGIDAARLKSAGFGADKPVADNRTEDGRARNRRVELVKL